MKKIYKNQAESASKLRGVWVIVVLSDITQSYLLQDGYLLIDERRIALYGDNPFLGENRVDTERVLIKDWPVWVSDGIITNYIKTQSPLKTNGIVFRSKARNNSNFTVLQRRSVLLCTTCY